mgnify:CR=1 FL=1
MDTNGTTKHTKYTKGKFRTTKYTKGAKGKFRTTNGTTNGHEWNHEIQEWNHETHEKRQGESLNHERHELIV